MQTYWSFITLKLLLLQAYYSKTSQQTQSVTSSKILSSTHSVKNLSNEREINSAMHGTVNIWPVTNASMKIDLGNGIYINTTASTHSRRYPGSTNMSTIICNHEELNQESHSNMSCYPPSAALQCFHDPFFCKKYFTSGKRELKDERPKYGEYSYLNHQLWFRVIQHGGIAFLFHPCTNKSEVEKLRQVASKCLHRYVLAPYDKLATSMPLALVSWGCFYLSSHVNASKMRWWIQEHAYSGPASHVHTNGKFQENLVKQSEVITDEKDAILCPSKEEINRYAPLSTASPLKNVVKVKKVDPESIINHRMDRLHSKVGSNIAVTANITVTKVETGSAVWAAASLIFLCGILVGWLLYTKQWVKVNDGGYKYNPLKNSDDTFECEPGQSEFNLLKSSQKFMSAFQLKDRRERRTDPLSKVNLMVPISEEDEDVLFER